MIMCSAGAALNDKRARPNRRPARGNRRRISGCRSHGVRARVPFLLPGCYDRCCWVVMVPLLLLLLALLLLLLVLLYGRARVLLTFGL